METPSCSFEGEMSTVKKKKKDKKADSACLTSYVEQARFTYSLEVWSMKTFRKIPHPHLLSSGHFPVSQ